MITTRKRATSILVLSIVTFEFAACSAVGPGAEAMRTHHSQSVAGQVDSDLVDCLLPGKIKTIAPAKTYVSPREHVKLSATACQRHGGEIQREQDAG